MGTGKPVQVFCIAK